MSDKKPKNASKTNLIVMILIGVIIINVSVISVLAFLLKSPGDKPEDDTAFKNEATEIAKENPTTAPSATVDPTDEMRKVVEKDFIYDGIFINDISVGGMSKEEAFETLSENFQKPFEEIFITYSYDGNADDHPVSDFDAGYNISAVVDEAFNYAREGNIEERYALITQLLSENKKIDLELLYNSDKLNSIVSDIAEKYNVPVVQPTVSRQDGYFSFTAGKNGQKIDFDKVINETTALLRNAQSGTIAVAINEVEPSFTQSDLEKATSVIGTYKTTFTTGDANRNQNIKNAASFINNVVVMPGEIFSTNHHFNPCTEANGYAPAWGYESGKLVKTIGGGMCQVSSTLYSALLYAELEIVERRNHSMPVGYVPGGMDATLSGDYIDLKFKNSTNYPIVVESIYTNGSIAVNIYGYESRDSGRTVDFVSKQTGSSEPEAEEVIDDPELPLGEKKYDQSAKNGSTWELYKQVYENGALVKEEFVNKSTYRAMRAVVRVGTGAPLPTEAPAEPEVPAVEGQTGEQPVEQPVEQESPVEQETPAEQETPVEQDPVVDDTPPEPAPTPYDDMIPGPTPYFEI